MGTIFNLTLTMMMALTLFATRVFASEIPFHRAINSLVASAMEPLIDDMVVAINEQCRDFPKSAKPSVQALFHEMCLLPLLINTYQTKMGVLNNKDRSGVIGPESDLFTFVKKYHLLKSLTWLTARATPVDPVAFVTEIFVLQLAISKSFHAYIELADRWNGRSKALALYLYGYPKIAAYLETNTLFGASLAYYENIRCELKDHARPLRKNHCYRYKSQVASELLADFDIIAPKIESFIEGLKSNRYVADDKDLLRVQTIWNLNQLLHATKEARSVTAISLSINGKVNSQSDVYRGIYNILQKATSQPITLGDDELVKFYLGVASILEVSTARQKLWSMKAFLKLEGAKESKSSLAPKLEAEFNEIHSAVHYFHEVQDAGI